MRSIFNNIDQLSTAYLQLKENGKRRHQYIAQTSEVNKTVLNWCRELGLETPRVGMSLIYWERELEQPTVPFDVHFLLEVTLKTTKSCVNEKKISRLTTRQV